LPKNIGVLGTVVNRSFFQGLKVPFLALCVDRKFVLLSHMGRILLFCPTCETLVEVIQLEQMVNFFGKAWTALLGLLSQHFTKGNYFN